MEEQINSHPQRNIFKFPHFGHEVIFDSDFDSGNMKKVVHTNPNYYSIWTASDCEGTEKEGYSKSWFYFSVCGFQNTTITFNLHRIQVLWSLLKNPEKYKPVFRRENQQWKRLETNVKSITNNYEGDIVTTFDFYFEKRQKVYFAFTYPYSYLECQQDLTNLSATYESCKQFYFKKHLLVQSPEKRNIDLVVISSHDSKEGFQTIPDTNILIQQKLIKFKLNKPVIMITARVHPLESPSSFCMNGIINFLLNKDDARAYFLRKNFVFLLIPMLNPDGVSRGHCRMDIFNQNLNRFYQTPTIEQQPSCYAVRKLVEHYQKDKKLFFYLDLHAHPANKGNFVFGNAIFDYVLQVESTLFPKLLSQNCINFQFDKCNFSRKHMKAKDRFEDMNKEGCGRVVLYRQFGIIHAYTLQCGYHTNITDNVLVEAKDTQKIYKLKYRTNMANEKIYESETVVKQKEEGFDYVGYEDDAMDNSEHDYYKQNIVYYNQNTYRNLGKNIVISILDIWNKNPYPRITDPNELRKEIAQQNSKLDRFKREQGHLKTKQKNIVTLIQENYYDNWNKRNVFNSSRQKPQTVNLNQRAANIRLVSLSKIKSYNLKKEESERETKQSETVIKQIRITSIKNAELIPIAQRKYPNIKITKKLQIYK